MIRRVLLVCVLILLVTPLAAKRRAVTPRPTVTIRVAALFSLTGDGASLGAASAAALELAARDINHELDLLQAAYHVEVDIEDTRLTPATAREKIELLHTRGAHIVLGPQSSAEAAAVLSYANEQGIVVISQGSTASSLAIPNDALFRLAPNDKLEGAAQAALARDIWQPVSDEIRERLGSAPDAYALSVYDAAWVAVLSAIEVANEEALLRDSFARNIQRYWGLTGPTILDTNGDRKMGNFDFWTIRVVNGTPEWVRTAQYSGGRLSR